jgi:lysophospholipase L1-like esterase
MHTHYITAIGGLCAAFLLGACSTEDDLIEERNADNPQPIAEPPPSGTPGTADFTKYVAIGNSLTAGFMDGALYTSGQQNAFPAILAQQFQIEGVGGGAFNLPDINSQNGFNTSLNDGSQPGTIFGRFVLNLTTQSIEPTVGEPITPYGGDRAQLNSFGVPGIRAIDAVVPGYGQANPFFGRFASSPTASLLNDAAQAQGTFFTVWLGSNDVLAWALSGGSAPDGEADPEAQATNPGTLTSVASFTEAYQGIISSMLATPEAKGVAINIPPVTLLPFFRAVSYNPVPLDEANAAALNGGYEQYNQGLDGAVALQQITAEEAARRKINFSAAPNNSVVIIDEDLSDIDLSITQGLPPGSIVLPKLRQTEETDLLLLSVSPLLGEEQTEGAGPYGLQDAVTDQYVLTLNEQVILIDRIRELNEEIATIVDRVKEQVALLDVNPLFADAFGLSPVQAAQLAMSPEAQAAADGTQGLVADGVVLTPTFFPNGIFSVDGIHPNPKGHAVVANEVIRVINESFDATIPWVDTTPYRTVLAPPI